jgi:hypothetical protein
LIVFQGVKRSGNTLAVLPKQATQENGQILSAQWVAEITACPVVASHPLAFRNGLNAI